MLGHFILNHSAYKMPTKTCSISDGFVWIDGLVQFAAIEEILQQFLNFGNASRAADQDDVVYGWFVHLGITKRLLDRLQGATEQVSVQLLKPGTSYAGVEVDAFKQRVYLD